MTKRLDAVAIREYEINGEKKSHSIKVGVAFPFKNGKEGFSLVLDAIPAPNDGQYFILLFPPKPKDESQNQSNDDYGNQSNGF